MLKERKEQIVSDLSDLFSKSTLVLLTDYRGMNVEKMNSLRNELYNADSKYVVIKNTLLKIALKEAGLYNEEMEPSLVGTTAVLYTAGDPIMALKAFHKFMDDNKIPTVKSGIIDGKFINAEEAKILSKLPPKDVLLARLVGQMQAPIYGFHAVLSGVMRKLVYALNGIKDKKSE